MTLDIFLPDMQGWRISTAEGRPHPPPATSGVRVVLDRRLRERALNSGAIGFIASRCTRARLIDEALARLKTYVTSAKKTLHLPDGESPERDALIERLARRRHRGLRHRHKGELCAGCGATRSTAWWCRAASPTCSRTTSSTWSTTSR
jgi:hypothetical protein